jgi:hypothetical protein
MSQEEYPGKEYLRSVAITSSLIESGDFEEAVVHLYKAMALVDKDDKRRKQELRHLEDKVLEVAIDSTMKDVAYLLVSMDPYLAQASLNKLDKYVELMGRETSVKYVAYREVMQKSIVDFLNSMFWS